MNEIELVLDYPSNLAKALRDNTIDVALLPVAVIPEIENARIISDYGIAADGKVASVALFSQVPVEEIQSVYLDYQSRTSVKLAELLLKHYWKKDVQYKPTPEHYIQYINNTTAGIIIGDRALKQLTNFEYVYDLAEAWKDFTGLPFVFAAWVANKELPQDFITAFNAANAEGLTHISEIAAQHPFPYYDLEEYYTKRIHYLLDEEKKRGLEKFLALLDNKIALPDS